MGDQKRPPSGRARLSVDGQRIPLNRFVERALVAVVEGFLSAMRDVPAGDVALTIPADRRPAAPVAAADE